MKHNFSIIRGTTSSFGVELFSEHGELYFLAENEKLIFGLKKLPTDNECILTKTFDHCCETGTDENGNPIWGYYFRLEAADTLKFPPGKYYYDIGLKVGESMYYNVVEKREFTIKPNITQLNDST